MPPHFDPWLAALSAERSSSHSLGDREPVRDNGAGPFMHMARRIAETFVLFLAAAALAAAPDATQAGLPIITVFDPATHRGGPQTFDIVQDRQGVLHFGNLHGLLSYDGAWWRLTRLPGSQVAVSMAVGADGGIAAGLMNDFGTISGDAVGAPRFESWRSLLPPAEREMGDIYDVCAVGNGFLFVAKERLIFANGKFARSLAVNPDTGPRGCHASGTAVVLRGRAGLWDFDVRKFTLDAPRIPNVNVRAIAGDPAGRMRIVSSDGDLFEVKGTVLTPWALEASKWLQGKTISGAVNLKDGRMVITTREHGLIVVRTGGTIEHVLDDRAGLPTAVLDEPFVDRHGSLWLAMEGPLVRIDVSSSVSVFDERLGLRGAVSDVAIHRGRLHVATSHGLFVMGPDGRFAQDLTVKGGVWRTVRAGADLLVAFTGEVRSINRTGVSSVVYQVDGRLVGDMRLSTSDPSRVWMTTSAGVGSLRREGDSWKFAGVLEGTPEDGTWVVERFGALWVGTTFGGVVRIENPLSRAPRQTRYGSDEMNVFLADGRVLLVDATYGRILQPADVRSPQGTIEHKVVADPVLGHVSAPGEYFVIAEDARGSLWLNSNPPRVIERLADGRFDAEAYPLASVYSTDIQNIRTDEDGAVWFCSDRGLFRYSPETAAGTASQPPPLIARITTGEDTVLFAGWQRAIAKAARLPYDFGRIRFDFAPATFAPGVTYQYRLDPMARDWSPWTSQASIDFTTLAPRHYTLRVRARSASGRASEHTEWSFEVVPPWYRTWWAIVLWVAILGSIVWAIFRLRTRSLRLHARELSLRVAEQTARLQETVGMLEEANHELQAAQEKIARFNESSGEALRDVRSWSKETAGDLAASVHAHQIVVSILSGGELIPVAPTEIRPPRLDDLELLPHKNTFLTTSEGHTVVAVPGLTGKVFGSLTVVGKPGTWTEPERQLISTFAHQLGGALELQQVRSDLADARERNAAARRQMTERGISLLKVCVRCSRCHEDSATRCAFDGSDLDSSRILPHRIAGRYRLVRLLGAGGMGEVFAGRDERLEREVAIKVIKASHFNDANVRSRFEREARAVARIQHPNVVAIYDSGEVEEGSAYIVTELLDGCDLGYVLRRHGRGSPQQVARLIREGGAALSAAHAVGLIHRDIKPANLFLVNGRNGFEVKLLDFGIAKTVDLESQFTSSGTLVGTPAYMAPEQVTRGHADLKTDLYSFAAVAYESLVGTRVSGNGGFAALWDVMYTEPHRPSTIRSGLPPAVDDAFASALAKTPDRRPDSVQSWTDIVASELERLATDEPPWPDRFAREERPSLVTIAATLGVDGPTPPAAIT